MLQITKISLIILLVIITCSKGDTYNDVVKEEWNFFKIHYDKIYGGSIEENYRSKIFMSNIKNIYQHNQRYELGLEAYKMKVNEYTDMFDFEIIKLMCGINGTELNENIKNDKFDGVSFIPPASIHELPDHVDWIAKGAVTEVKNQGHCGSCWAFSATGSLEGQTFRLNNKLISLSEQNLMDCSRMYGNKGCYGGLMNKAFHYIQDNDGIDTEKSYPYKAIDLDTCQYRKSEKGASCRGYTILPPFNENTLKTAVATIGPISIAIQATNKFMFYSEGIFYDSSCSKSSEDVNHAVLIVGYGTDQSTGQEYWLVKNSWGKEWGINGYIKMARNKDNNCNIATFGIYPLL